MLEAYREGMTNGEFVFMTVNLLPSDNVARRWFEAGKNDNEVARLAFQPVIQVCTY